MEAGFPSHVSIFDLIAPCLAPISCFHIFNFFLIFPNFLLWEMKFMMWDLGFFNFEMWDFR